MLPAQKVYHELVNDSEGAPRHAVVTPRDPTQIKNFRKPLAAEARLSHDSIYNVYQLCYQLKMNNRKGEAKDFIRHVSVYPNIILHLLAQPLLDSLELLLRLPLSHVYVPINNLVMCIATAVNKI